jgi:hypothetical protein
VQVVVRDGLGAAMLAGERAGARHLPNDDTRSVIV